MPINFDDGPSPLFHGIVQNMVQRELDALNPGTPARPFRDFNGQLWGTEQISNIWSGQINNATDVGNRRR